MSERMQPVQDQVQLDANGNGCVEWGSDKVDATQASKKNQLGNLNDGKTAGAPIVTHRVGPMHDVQVVPAVLCHVLSRIFVQQESALIMVEIRRRYASGSSSRNDVVIFLVTYAICTLVCASLCVYFSMKFKGLQ